MPSNICYEHLNTCKDLRLVVIFSSVAFCYMAISSSMNPTDVTASELHDADAQGQMMINFQ